MKLTQVQSAYLAGFIDGEGSLECQKQMQKRGATPRYVLRLSFTLATPEPLRTFGTWFPCVTRVYPSSDPRRSPRHRMQIPKNTAVQIIRLCLPFLRLKREQAELILAIEEVRARFSPNRKDFTQKGSKPMNPDAVEKMESLYRRLRSLKSNKRAMHCRINQ